MERRDRRFERERVLSEREQSVLEALAVGHSTATAARELNLSPHTVRTYIQTAKAKLNAHTRTQAVAIALARGDISASTVRTAADLPGEHFGVPGLAPQARAAHDRTLEPVRSAGRNASATGERGGAAPRPMGPTALDEKR